MNAFTEQEHKLLRKLTSEGIASRLNTGKNRDEVQNIMHLKLKIVDHERAPETTTERDE